MMWFAAIKQYAADNRTAQVRRKYRISSRRTDMVLPNNSLVLWSFHHNTLIRTQQVGEEWVRRTFYL